MALLQASTSASSHDEMSSAETPCWTRKWSASRIRGRTADRSIGISKCKKVPEPAGPFGISESPAGGRVKAGGGRLFAGFSHCDSPCGDLSAIFSYSVGLGVEEIFQASQVKELAGLGTGVEHLKFYAVVIAPSRGA